MKSAELPDVQMILQLESPPAQKKVEEEKEEVMEVDGEAAVVSFSFFFLAGIRSLTKSVFSSNSPIHQGKLPRREEPTCRTSSQ